MKGSKKYWILAILFGLAATVLAYRYIAGVKARYEPKNLVQVVVAATDIPKNSVITREKVKLELVPAQFAHPAAVRDLDEVVGRVAASYIVAGEEILSAKIISDAEKTNKLAYAVPMGKRAVSVPVNAVSGVSGLVRPGDRVDVIATVELASGQENVAVTSFILQDVEVLAVDQNLDETKPVPAAKEEAAPATTVTLAVTPEEARPLVLASEQGSIRLALRAPADHDRVMLPPVRLVDIVGGQ
ncbi:Flp pilus assembly protein CpaB [Syntrophothermus lipocalidus]|uniref:Flp pilus assembly protein CpaB n=1 Tax=Syntrophothermus lipocalidus (strain DSM 12680 / TGB-C1) TaxID=643648 RepID=D7CPP6_SYNLT|nr:Flp pilus assembly protein CpaB [Syntrophothermus lipocalidus]ADI02674.1 Flp pilus assembly protein CpaB [Syntrophothermus lipocalidus DSM 12680]